MNTEEQRFSHFRVYLGNEVYLDDIILEREMDVDTATKTVAAWNEFPETFKLVGY